MESKETGQIGVPLERAIDIGNKTRTSFFLSLLPPKGVYRGVRAPVDSASFYFNHPSPRISKQNDNAVDARDKRTKRKIVQVSIEVEETNARRSDCRNLENEAEARKTDDWVNPKHTHTKKTIEMVPEEQGSHWYNAVKMQIFILNPPTLNLRS